MSPLVTETRAALARLTSVDDMRALVTGMAETIDQRDAQIRELLLNHVDLHRIMGDVSGNHVAALILINSVIDNLRKMVDMPRSAEAQRLAVQLLESLEKFGRNHAE